MLHWVFIFLGISVISGLLGFSNISAAAGGIAKFLFYIFLFLFLAALIMFFVAGGHAHTT